MRETTRTLYRAREFADLTGVTVRTLHHYDRLGLLKPGAGRTPSGYRLYGAGDFARLQQIVTLKFIGVPLKQIKSLLGQRELDLKATLRLQRQAIEAQRRQLDIVIHSIARAERVAAAGSESNWEAFKKIIEVINMDKDMTWTDKFYSDEAKAALAEKRRTVTPEEVEQGQRDWATLIAEVEAAVKGGEDPASEKAQGLASRWMNLIKAFTGGNQAIQEGLNKMHSDKSNWPASKPRPYSDEVMDFIRQAMAAHKKD